MYRTLNVTMDCACILFSVMILVYLRLSSDRGERLNRLFAGICLFNIGMLLGDIPNWLCEGFSRPWFPLALWSGCLLLYLSGCLITWVYTLYLHSYLAQKSQTIRWTLKVANVLSAVDLVLIMLNLWNGMYYRIDGQNIYHRGEWYWLSQAIPIVILLIDSGIILHHRHKLKLKEIAAFLGYLMLPIVGVIIQMQLYGIAVTYLTSTVALFIIFLNIQSEQRFLFEQQGRDLDRANIIIMLSQIKPHFLYNSLSGIKHLCDTDPKKASDALESFTHFLRGNLDALSDTHLISFADEIRHVENYLYLEKMRFGKFLQVQWNIQRRDFMLPPLTLQPIVENAVIHGITKKRGGGTLTIGSEETDGAIIISVADDGVGFDAARETQNQRPHIGIENARKRLAAQCGGTLEIWSESGTGTVVKIRLPKKTQ